MKISNNYCSSLHHSSWQFPHFIFMRCCYATADANSWSVFTTGVLSSAVTVQSVIHLIAFSPAISRAHTNFPLETLLQKLDDKAP